MAVFILFPNFRGHFESLPEILNEIWEVMGDSGEAIRKSLLWIIETVSFSSIYVKLKYF
jgi:hypothetical protein